MEKSEEEVSEADRQLHKKISTEVKTQLEAKGKSTENVEFFEEFYELLQQEAKTLRKKYQPQLRNGINITIDLINQVQQDKKDGDVDIKVTIAPNKWEETFSIEGHKEGDLSYNVDKLLIDSNTGMAQDKAEAQGTLSRIEQYFSEKKGAPNITKLGDDNTSLFDKIRGKDMKWSPMQGYIYIPFVLEHQEAIKELQQSNQESENNLALVGIERGGTMLADQVNQNADYPVIYIEKGQEDDLAGDSKKTDANNLINQIIAIADKEENTDKKITITVTETVVGGGSANLILQRLNKALKNRPNLTIKLLLLQQTGHSSESTENADTNIQNNLNALSMPKTEGNISGKVNGIPYGQVVVCKAGTTFTLGEDVDYQLSKTGEHSQKPIILFSFNDEKLIVKRVTPQNTTKSRDIIIGLAKNNLDPRILSDMK